MDKSIPLNQLVTAPYWPWELSGFTVENANSKEVRIYLPGNDDPTTQEVVLGDLGRKMKKEGFSVVPVVARGTRFTNRLLVSVIWAEDKLSPHAAEHLSGEEHPNYDKFHILAAGPLIRESGMEPRRIVLRQARTYVVHTQAIPDGKRECWFDRGDYFQDESDRPKAMKRFYERMIELDAYGFPAFYAQK